MVTFEVSSCTKFQKTLRGAYSAPQTPDSWWVGVSLPLPKNLTPAGRATKLRPRAGPALGPSGLWGPKLRPPPCWDKYPPFPPKLHHISKDPAGGGVTALTQVGKGFAAPSPRTSPRPSGLGRPKFRPPPCQGQNPPPRKK